MILVGGVIFALGCLIFYICFCKWNEECKSKFVFKISCMLICLGVVFFAIGGAKKIEKMFEKPVVITDNRNVKITELDLRIKKTHQEMLNAMREENAQLAQEKSIELNFLKRKIAELKN